MINLNEAVLAKAKQAKSVEELVTLAKESGIEMTAEQVQDIFAQLNQKSGELADDELNNVAGGGCYHPGPEVDPTYSCSYWMLGRCDCSQIECKCYDYKYCKTCKHMRRMIDACYCCTHPSNKNRG